MDAVQTKSVFTSKTVIGLVVAAVGMVAPLLQQKFGIIVTGADASALLDQAGHIAESVGMLFALYGRVKATKKIG